MRARERETGASSIKINRRQVFSSSRVLSRILARDILFTRGPAESRDHHENSRPPVDKVRVVREKKKERTAVGEEGRESPRRGQGRPGSKRFGREESVGGIPLAPRDDNHLVSRGDSTRLERIQRAFLRERELGGSSWNASARSHNLSSPEIIVKILSRICRYFVTRLAHTWARLI